MIDEDRSGPGADRGTSIGRRLIISWLECNHFRSYDWSRFKRCLVKLPRFFSKWIFENLCNRKYFLLGLISNRRFVCTKIKLKVANREVDAVVLQPFFFITDTWHCRYDDKCIRTQLLTFKFYYLFCLLICIRDQIRTAMRVHGVQYKTRIMHISIWKIHIVKNAATLTPIQTALFCFNCGSAHEKIW